jgi:hypothetical protein
MAKALLDSTVAVDILLKPSGPGVRARAAVERYTQALIPVFALKELKSGALANAIWFHNLICERASLAEAFAVATTQIRFNNKGRTAMEVHAELLSHSPPKLTPELTAEYNEDPVEYNREFHRRECRTLILKAWKKRRSFVPGLRVICEAPCFDEREPIAVGIKLAHPPNGCTLDSCGLTEILRANKKLLRKLLAFNVARSASPEYKRRAEALEALLRKDVDFSPANCRKLGDAHFAIICPGDAIVLTSNLSHHRELTQEVGRIAEDYEGKRE